MRAGRVGVFLIVLCVPLAGCMSDPWPGSGERPDFGPAPCANSSGDLIFEGRGNAVWSAEYEPVPRSGYVRVPAVGVVVWAMPGEAADSVGLSVNESVASAGAEFPADRFEFQAAGARSYVVTVEGSAWRFAYDVASGSWLRGHVGRDDGWADATTAAGEFPAVRIALPCPVPGRS